ncbi:MAG: hypothetical protein P4L98_25205 [Ancalomicrobiaceae bacterium]|nr:hypothetical protein [Ancalomicrobiaceae bacterium]
MRSKYVILALTLFASTTASAAMAAQPTDAGYANTSYGDYLKELRGRLDPHGQLSERDLLMLAHSLEGTGSSGYW